MTPLPETPALSPPPSRPAPAPRPASSSGPRRGTSPAGAARRANTSSAADTQGLRPMIEQDQADLVGCECGARPADTHPLSRHGPLCGHRQRYRFVRAPTGISVRLQEITGPHKAGTSSGCSVTTTPTWPTSRDAVYGRVHAEIGYCYLEPDYVTSARWRVADLGGQPVRVRPPTPSRPPWSSTAGI